MPSGGKREGAGRKPGGVNEDTKRARLLAQKYAPKAMKELARLGLEGESESARVAANVAILDRAYGKPAQALEHSGKDGAPFKVVISAADAKIA